jgi:sec-independent protein translocase protein TatB
VFNIGGLELLVIVVIALIVLGPEKLPQLGRTLGRIQREATRTLRALYREIEEAERDAYRSRPEDLTDPGGGREGRGRSPRPPEDLVG